MGSRELLERSRRGDPVLIGVRVVVSFQIGEAVLIVHRQTIRTIQPGRGRVSHPIQSLQPRAVGEVKTGDSILCAKASVRRYQIARTPFHHFRLECDRRGSEICGSDGITLRDQRRERVRDRRRCSSRPFQEPLAKPRNG